jgi:RNA-directed DNA polymerase
LKSGEPGQYAYSSSRLGRFGLQLHPDKTRLVDFRPAGGPSVREDKALPTTFVFLGFTHVWGVSRKGNKAVRQFTAKARLARSLKAFNQQCRRMMHWPMAAQHDRLCRMLKGHYGYFGITGNFRRLVLVYREVQWVWRRWLARRSSKSYLTWETYKRVLQRLALPLPRRTPHYDGLTRATANSGRKPPLARRASLFSKDAIRVPAIFILLRCKALSICHVTH